MNSCSSSLSCHDNVFSFNICFISFCRLSVSTMADGVVEWVPICGSHVIDVLFASCMGVLFGITLSGIMLIFTFTVFIRGEPQPDEQSKEKKPKMKATVSVVSTYVRPQLPADWTVVNESKMKVCRFVNNKWDVPKQFTRARVIQLADGKMLLHSDESLSLPLTQSSQYRVMSERLHTVHWDDQEGQHVIGLQFWDPADSVGFAQAVRSGILGVPTDAIRSGSGEEADLSRPFSETIAAAVSDLKRKVEIDNDDD